MVVGCFGFDVVFRCFWLFGVFSLSGNRREESISGNLDIGVVGRRIRAVVVNLGFLFRVSFIDPLLASQLSGWWLTIRRTMLVCWRSSRKRAMSPSCSTRLPPRTQTLRPHSSQLPRSLSEALVEVVEVVPLVSFVPVVVVVAVVEQEHFVAVVLVALRFGGMVPSTV